jgi:hypothetical protein
MPEQSEANDRFVDAGEEEIDLDATRITLPSGRRLTDDLAEELVVQARRGAGRPSLDGEAENSPRIAFRVPQRVKEELEAIASVEGKSFSEVSREAIESYLTHRRSA